jgi:hypothetical protein
MTVLESIVAFVFGKKYYANIVNTRGTDKCEMTSFIWRTKADAERHRKAIESTRTFDYIETVTFRSRKEY